MQLVHNVFFTLKERTPAGAEKLVSECKRYLTVQPGIVFFACGTLETELNREVNDLDWDVGLHIVFETRAAHDAYQVDPAHVRFIESNKPTWAKVRVFDSLCEGS